MSDNNVLNSAVPGTICTTPGADGKDNCIAVSMLGGAAPWLLRFWALLGGRRIYLGGVRTYVAQPERLVAIVSCPAAQRFEVEGHCYDSRLADQISLFLTGFASTAGPWGVQNVPGNSVEGSRSIRTITGVNGVILVVGEVHGWSVESAAGGTLTIVVSPTLTIGPITIPAGVPVSGNYLGKLGPQSVWTFVGTDNYLIETIPPGGTLDG